MASPEQRAQIVAILDAADDLTIATNREDGYPQATTVSFVNDGPSIYFGTWTQSQKAKNIARDNRVSVTVDAPYKDWDGIRSLSIGGRAQRVTAAEEQQRVGGLMISKFPRLGEFVKSQSPTDLALYRVDAEIVSILDYSKGFGHTEYARLP